MRKLVPSNAFKLDMKKQSLELFVSEEWLEITHSLSHGFTMKEKYHDHDLKGEWKGFRECHIQPDLLLIYAINNNKVELSRIGSHAALFG